MNETVTAEGKLDIGGVFSRTGEIYKQAFGTVWIIALVLFIPVIILNAISGSGDSWWLNLIAGVAQVLASVWFAGTVVKVVQDVEADGVVDASVGELLGLVWPRLISLIVLGIVVGVLVAVGFFVFTIPGALLDWVWLLILGSVIGAIVAVGLTLRWIVSTPAMMVEGKGVFDSMARSSELTEENRMRVLGVGLLILVAYIVLALIVILLAIVTPILAIVAGIGLFVAVYPYLALISSVLYFNLVEVKGGRVVPGGGPTAGIEQPGEVEIVEEIDPGERP